QATQSASGDLSELLRRWPEPQVTPLGPEGERPVSDIIASLERAASREIIHHGRCWIEANAHAAPAIACYIMRRVMYLPTCGHRINVLFLLHDLFQNEVAKQDPSRPVISAFKPYLVWILRPCFQMANSMSPSGEDCSK
ncbi:unnamed protein product, partial [Polarella glacialis]